MHRASRWRLGACVLALLAGCGEDSSPAAAPAPIRTDEERYVLRPNVYGGREASIVATFTAPEGTTVYVPHCNGAIPWGLQRRAGGGWEDAWVAILNGCFSPPFVVPGGGSRTDTLVLQSRTDIPDDTATVRHEIEPGVYRVVWYGLMTSFDPQRWSMPGRELALEHCVSAPIVIAVER